VSWLPKEQIADRRREGHFWIIARTGAASAGLMTREFDDVETGGHDAPKKPGASVGAMTLVRAGITRLYATSRHCARCRLRKRAVSRVQRADQTNGTKAAIHRTA
jgi:hypothetical protein